MRKYYGPTWYGLTGVGARDACASKNVMIVCDDDTVTVLRVAEVLSVTSQRKSLTRQLLHCCHHCSLYNCTTLHTLHQCVVHVLSQLAHLWSWYRLHWTRIEARSKHLLRSTRSVSVIYSDTDLGSKVPQNFFISLLLYNTSEYKTTLSSLYSSWYCFFDSTKDSHQCIFVKIEKFLLRFLFSAGPTS